MARWFRFYTEVLNDPKVQRMDGETFKFWINILCIASENDGHLPDVADMAFALRMDENACLTVVERLLNGGLIDRLNGGANGWHYAPHGWTKRQYKSDGSTDRVKRFRERSKSVSETPPEQIQNTETERSNKQGFAFDGNVIKLKKADFGKWEKAFPLVDLAAALQSRDDWLSSQGDDLKKRWFMSTSNWLSSKQQSAKKTERNDDEWSMPIA